MKLAACIVETRPFPDLVKIINGHMKHLPASTKLFIFHGDTNNYLRAMFPEAEFHHLAGPMTLHRYNTLLTSTDFWTNFLEYDKVLIFQHDSMILRPGIEEFYGWDYIGAPWKWQQLGGNGGISLRTPKIMYDIAKDYGMPQGWNEDVHICRIMSEYGIGKLAPREECLKFGTEAVFALNTFCYHAIDQWLTVEQCKQIKNQLII